MGRWWWDRPYSPARWVCHVLVPVVGVFLLLWCLMP